MNKNQKVKELFTDKLVPLGKFHNFTLEERSKWQKCFVCGKWACIWTPDKLPAIQGFLFCYKHYKEHKQNNKEQGDLFNG